MLKVWSTEALWQMINDTIQIHGGQALFTDQPYERWMRDARLNQIGEGANDVLRAFIALVGMRGVGEELKSVLDAVRNPIKSGGKLWGFVRGQVGARLSIPEVPVQSHALRKEAADLGRRVRDFGLAVQWVLRKYREAVLERQYVQERIADAACELYAASCTLSRLDHLLSSVNGNPVDLNRDLVAGRYFLKLADRRIRQCLAALADNDDEMTTAAADAALGR
jgi:alkylation response protein AidB-like acyl-CoA dehydrogenase